MAEIQDALTRAIAAMPGRVPRGFTAQVRALGGRGRNPAARVARIFGVTPRTAKGWLGGSRPSKRNRDAAQAATDAVADLRKTKRAQAAAAAGGLVVETRATFGYDAPMGSTDESRLRRITQALPGDTAAALFAAYARKDEGGMNAAVAAGLGEAYFRDGNRRASGLNVALTDIDYIDFDIRE